MGQQPALHAQVKTGGVVMVGKTAQAARRRDAVARD